MDTEMKIVVALCVVFGFLGVAYLIGWQKFRKEYEKENPEPEAELPWSNQFFAVEAKGVRLVHERKGEVVSSLMGIEKTILVMQATGGDLRVKVAVKAAGMPVRALAKGHQAIEVTPHDWSTEIYLGPLGLTSTPASYKCFECPEASLLMVGFGNFGQEYCIQLVLEQC